MNQRITYLFDRYFDKTATSQERLELADLVRESQDHETLLRLIDRSWENYDGLATSPVPEKNRNAILSQILANNTNELAADLSSADNNPASSRIIHRVHFLKTAWFRYAAAVLFIISVGYSLLINTSRNNNQTSVSESVAAHPDIAPAGSRALLQLADGTVIDLGNAADGQLATQQGSSIQKRDGEVIYDPQMQHPASVTYNTMSTPRGGQYSLSLADGTRVWLNAASSITFPTSFNQKTREVSITGEVYFEVKPDKTQPFVVKARTESITVLGTSFNVRTYADETVSKTSLIEGSIRIADQLLQPGQAYMNGHIVTTDIHQDIAWKNGIFDFSNTDIESAMRQFERWYDIEVIFEGERPAFDFQGKLPRSLTLQQLLKALNKVGLQSKLEGRKLIVSPKTVFR